MVVINDGTGEYNNPYVIGQNNIDNNETDIYTGGIGDKSSVHSEGSV